MTELYLDPHQSRDREPTARENAIGDTIERCYAAGETTIAGLVAALDAAKIPGPGGQPWSEENFCGEMALLGR